MEPQKITVTIPKRLLDQIDTIAGQKLISRSGVVRQALQFYCYEKGVPRGNFKKTAKAPDDYSEILRRHPTMSPDDIELLKFYKEKEL